MRLPFNSLFAIAGVGTLLLSMGGLTAAHADRDYDRLKRAVHHDIDMIDHDKHRINDLRHKADDQSARRDWHGLHRTQDQIDSAKFDLERDRDNLKADQEALDSYHHRY